MARESNMLGRHFIEWYIEDILNAKQKNAEVIFVIHKIDFHEPLKSIVLQYYEEREVCSNL